MSSALNVARWSALVGGIGYGIVHKRTLQKEYDSILSYRHERFEESELKRAQHAYKDSLVVKKTAGPISDPEDPKFDLEKYIEWATAAKA